MTEENLGIKVGTREEALWTKVKKARLQMINDLEEALIVEKSILELAESKIKEEELKH